MTDIERLAQSLDDWCVKRMGELKGEMEPYILAGGNLNDPQYRSQLGEHRAYMHMRSYLHGMRTYLENQE